MSKAAKDFSSIFTSYVLSVFPKALNQIFPIPVALLETFALEPGEALSLVLRGVLPDLPMKIMGFYHHFAMVLPAKAGETLQCRK